MRRILLTLALLLYPYSAWAGNAVYVHPTTGSDGDNGLTWANAKATCTGAFAITDVGDTVVFAPGSYYDCFEHPPGGGSNSNWTMYVDSTWFANRTTTHYSTYGAGSGAPKLYGGHIMSGWVPHDTVGATDIWKHTFQTVHQYAISGTEHLEACLSIIIDDDSMLVPVDPSTSVAAVTSQGRFASRWTSGGSNNDTVYAWILGGGDPDLRTSIIGSTNPVFVFGETENNVSHVKVQGLDLRNGKAGVIVNDKDNKPESVFVNHCYVSREGFVIGENGSGWLCVNSDEGPDGDYCYLRACSLSWFMTGGNGTLYGSNGGTGHGGAVTIYGEDHFIVDTCFFAGFSKYGVSIKNDNLNPDTPFTGTTIKYSVFQNMGEGVAIRSKADRDSVYGCIFKNMNTAIGFDAGAQFLGPSFERGCRILNNSFYDVTKAVGVIDQTAPGCEQGNPNWIKWNVIQHYDGTVQPFEGLQGIMSYSGTVDQACRNEFMFDSNFYSRGAGSVLVWGCSSNDQNWGTWRTCTGAGSPDLNSDTATAVAYVDGPGGDFSPTSIVPPMNKEYGGQVWTKYGAIQGEAGNICPSVVVNSPANGAILTDYTPTIDADFFDTDGDTIDLFLIFEIGDTSPEDTIADTFLVADDDWLYTLGTLVEDGTYYYKYIGTDTAGCTFTSSIRSFTIDSIPSSPPGGFGISYGNKIR